MEHLKELVVPLNWISPDPDTAEDTSLAFSLSLISPDPDRATLNLSASIISSVKTSPEPAKDTPSIALKGTVTKTSLFVRIEIPFFHLIFKFPLSTSVINIPASSLLP